MWWSIFRDPIFIPATTSFVSESEGSVSRTESSSKESESNTQSNDESDLEISKSKKARSESSKNRKEITEEVVEEFNENMEEADVNVETKQVDKKRKQGDKRGKKDDKKRKKDDKEGKQADKEGKQDGTEDKQDDKKRNKEKKRKRKSKDNVDGEDRKNRKEKNGKKGKKKSQDTQNETVSKEETKKSLVVVESSSGTESSITKLLTTSFKISDRVLLVTGWGDFFLAQDNNVYFLLDGCLCESNALIQINLSDLDSAEKLDDIDGIVNKIMNLKSTKNVTIESESDGKNLSEASDIGEENSAFSGDMDAPLWELIEGMIELMKTTAKFDKIKSELV